MCYDIEFEDDFIVILHVLCTALCVFNICRLNMCSRNKVNMIKTY